MSGVGVCRVQVSIPYSSGVPSDVITNTWHFQTLDGEPIDSAHCALLFTDLQSFYQGVYANTVNKAMANYLRPDLTLMKAYDLDDPKPRTAVRESIVNVVVGTQPSTTQPAETAAVMSYKTTYQSGIAKGSQRGRIYLGGLSDAMINPSNTSVAPSLKPNFCSSVGAAATSLKAAALAHDWLWVVYSEKLQDAFDVDGGWVDNALDTQRRRGVAATLRNLFVA